MQKRDIVRRVSLSSGDMCSMILAILVLLAIFVVLWRFPAWLTAPAPPVRHAAQLAGARILDVIAVIQQHLVLVVALGLARSFSPYLVEAPEMAGCWRAGDQRPSDR